MFKFKFFCQATLAVFTLFVCALAAQAQTPQVFVAANGVDGGSCKLAEPCRTFNYALTQVSAKGEIVALDSGDYEPVVINKAVTIQAAPGVYAGITVTGGNVSAVRVQAGASDAVTLRGLTLYAQGGQLGQTGISFTAGATLHVENCVLNGFTNMGISALVGESFVKDTTVRDSGTSIFVRNDASPVKAVIENCRLENGIHGVHASSNSKVSVRNTVAAGHSSRGFMAVPAVSTGTTAELNLENCSSTGNIQGIIAEGSSTVRVSNSTITGNNIGIGFTGNGALLSRGNNTVEGNNSNGNFSGTYSAK